MGFDGVTRYKGRFNFSTGYENPLKGLMVSRGIRGGSITRLISRFKVSNSRAFMGAGFNKALRLDGCNIKA